jgi:DNA-directed RNA polymerase specialized sigma24 family protein
VNHAKVGESFTDLFRHEEEYRRFRQRLIYFFERRECIGADILADECFKRLAEYIRSKGHPDDVNSFVFGIAKRVYLEHMRDAGRLAGQLPDIFPSESDTPSAQESRLIAQQIVGSLSADDRELMEAHFFDKLSWKSLASQTGKTEVALRLRVMRLRDRLMRDFGEQLKSVGLKRRAWKRSDKGESK